VTTVRIKVWPQTAALAVASHDYAHLRYISSHYVVIEQRRSMTDSIHLRSVQVDLFNLHVCLRDVDTKPPVRAHVYLGYEHE